MDACLTLNLFPSTYAICIGFRNVLGAIISSHCLSTAFVCWIWRTRTRQVFFGGLHDAFGSLVAFMHAVPVFALSCLRMFF